MPTFAVPGMNCSKCTAKIEKSVTEADPTALLEFDMDARTVEIDSADDAAVLLAAINSAGFDATTA
jgi:copper chaperone CopZ